MNGSHSLSPPFASQGYTDNSGLAPLLATHLASGETHGRILVLVMNQLGDHQMETYFERSGGDGGLLCQHETSKPSFDETYNEMDIIHRKAFAHVKGTYIPRENESTCAIRVARSVFFKVISTLSINHVNHSTKYTLPPVPRNPSVSCCRPRVQGEPPQHHRFEDLGVPSHVTYAYKARAEIAENKDFYTLPEGRASKPVELLFLMANAAVGTMSLPVSGSESYAGTAVTMKLAMEALHKKFPEFFGEKSAHEGD